MVGSDAYNLSVFAMRIKKNVLEISSVDVIDLPKVGERGHEGAREARKGVPKTIVYRAEHGIPYASDGKDYGNRAVAEFTKERHCWSDLSCQSFTVRAAPISGGSLW